MQFSWHPYKYLPYEKDLAIREIQSLLRPQSVSENDGLVSAIGARKPANAERLVYFASYSSNGGIATPTQQCLLERVNGNGVNRQSTRYSAHGLHEYKGRFNPQIAKSILNIFDVQKKHLVLDPFCGSGTSLIECAHLGIRAVGTDINPLAVFLANAKIKALSCPADNILRAARNAVTKARRSKSQPQVADERGAYLSAWFPEEHFRCIERLRVAIEDHGAEFRQILLSMASNLLRDYSLQEPQDLRIRRRKSPFPEIGFLDAYESAVTAFCQRLSEAQSVISLDIPDSLAINIDCKKPTDDGILKKRSFDAALTSPPYATALPYIDTQRLSLVWLGLLPPTEILPLEARLVGSREIRGPNKRAHLTSLEVNKAKLPKAEWLLCKSLQDSLTDEDGFRRQAVPRLLYRYFSDMADAFESVGELMKPNAHFGLIIGGNHTVLSGKRFDIDTPKHLANLAHSRGWKHIETIPLQTYKRYGLHASNATTTESLVILRAD